MAKNYWQKRSEQIIIDSEKMSAKMERTKLKQAYQAAYRELVRQINDVHAQLTEQGFSADMAQALTSGEKKIYADLVKQYNTEAALLRKKRRFPGFEAAVNGS